MSYIDDELSMPADEMTPLVEIDEEESEDEFGEEKNASLDEEEFI